MSYSQFYIQDIGLGEILPEVKQYLSKVRRSKNDVHLSQRYYRTYAAALQALDAIEKEYWKANKKAAYPRLIQRDEDLLLVTNVVFRIRSIVKYGKDS